MTEACPIDLSYGHFGELAYDTQNRSWLFARTNQDGRRLRPLGGARALLPSPQSPWTRNYQSAKERSQAIKLLNKTYPELVPSATLLPVLEQASESIRVFALEDDPLVSDRIAFGRALNSGHLRAAKGSMPILAVVGGEAGDILHILPIGHSDVGWPDGHGSILKTLHLQDQVQGLWTGNQGPILQVQFGQTNGEPNAWLAIRCPGATILFRPVLYESDVSSGPHVPLLCSPRNRPVFHFDPNHIATLPVQHSGGSVHVDFSFNPWNSNEMAIIDQSRNWSVWRIRSVNISDNRWQLDPGPSGRLTTTMENADNLEYAQLALDGWSMVRWVDKGRMLLFFGRKNVTLFNLHDGSERIIGLHLGLADTGDCILDVQLTLSSKQYLFVLTSSRIFWLRLDIEHSESGEQPPLALQNLQSWHHLRYEEEKSLKFDLVDRETRFIVLLFSRKTQIKTVFTFGFARSSTNFPVSVCDPYVVHTSESTQVSSAKVSTIVSKIIDSSQVGHAVTLDDNQAEFIQFFILNNDLSLEECYLVNALPDHGYRAGPPQILNRQRISKSQVFVQDDFIAPNGVLDEEDQEAEVCDASTSSSEENTDVKESISKDLAKSIHFEWLTDFKKSQETGPFTEELHRISTMISDRPGLFESGRLTLRELHHPDAMVEDIEEDSMALNDLLYELGNRNIIVKEIFAAYKENFLPFPSLHPLSSSEGTQLTQTLAHTYDALVDIWMSKLARRIPGRERIVIEKMIRNIAAELQLARYSIGSMSLKDQMERSLQNVDPSGFGTFILPVRGVPQASDGENRAKRKAPKIPSSLIASSPSARQREHISAGTLPIPEPAPSIRQGTSSSTLNNEEDPTVQRLQIFAQLSPQPLVPASITGILSHWSGTSPEDYNWEACQNITDIMEEPQDKEDQARAKKKRRIKPQQFQQQLQDPTSLLSQPAVSLIQQSQPETLPPSILSSNPTPGQLNMSQPEPGRFASGARTKKRAGKRPGF